MDNNDNVVRELLELKTSVATLSVKIDSLSESHKKLDERLVEIEKSYNRSMGAIALATFLFTLILGGIFAFANLWVSAKFNELFEQKNDRLQRLEKLQGIQEEKGAEINKNSKQK